MSVSSLALLEEDVSALIADSDMVVVMANKMAETEIHTNIAINL